MKGKISLEIIAILIVFILIIGGGYFFLGEKLFKTKKDEKKDERAEIILPTPQFATVSPQIIDIQSNNQQSTQTQLLKSEQNEPTQNTDKTLTFIPLIKSTDLSNSKIEKTDNAFKITNLPVGTPIYMPFDGEVAWYVDEISGIEIDHLEIANKDYFVSIIGFLNVKNNIPSNYSKVKISKSQIIANIESSPDLNSSFQLVVSAFDAKTLKPKFDILKNLISK